MALFDLSNELKKESMRVDDSNARTLTEALIARLDDVNADVQSVAIKWCVHCCLTIHLICLFLRIPSFPLLFHFVRIAHVISCGVC